MERFAEKKTLFFGGADVAKAREYLWKTGTFPQYPQGYPQGFSTGGFPQTAK
jgi:hypothetical protein